MVKATKAKGPVSATITLSEDPKDRYEGRQTFLDNVVDRSTGTMTAGNLQTIGPGMAVTPIAVSSPPH